MSGAAAPIIAGLGGYLASLGTKAADEVVMHPVKQGVKGMYGDNKKPAATDLRTAVGPQQQQPMPASSPALPIVGQAGQMATQEPSQGSGLMGQHPMRGIGNGILAMASLGLGQDPMKIIAQQQQMAMQERQAQAEAEQHRQDVERESQQHQADQLQHSQEFSQGLAQDQATLKAKTEESAAARAQDAEQFKATSALNERKLGIEETNARADRAYRGEQTALAKQQAQKAEMGSLMAAYTALQQHDAMFGGNTATEFVRKHALLNDYLGTTDQGQGAPQAQAQPQGGTMMDQLRQAGVPEAEIRTVAASKNPMAAAQHAIEAATTTQRLESNNNRQFAGKVHDDYSQDPITKDYAAIGNFHTNIEALKKNPGMFSDMSILYSYGHTVDPTSVVRQEEMDMYRNNGSMPDRIRAMYDRVVGGGNLSANERADLIKTTEAMYKGKTERYQKTRQNYANTAKNIYKIPEDQINDLLPDYTANSEPSLDQAGGGPPVGTVMGGFKFKGGNPNDKNSWEPAQ